MLRLFSKELTGYFSSLTGYIVIIIFLLSTSLFIWIFPGDVNIPESGYAHLTPLFQIAPWVFLFLAPAVTMRFFSEEKKSGTLDLLLTKPISDFKIVFAKFLAGVTIVLFALIPTLIYYYSVSQLASPPGNIDHGATIGSYLGLFFLAAIYVAIGVFSSSLAQNQIIAFLIAFSLSFVIFVGFQAIGTLVGDSHPGFIFNGLAAIFSFDPKSLLIEIGFLIKQLGIEEHYRSISRGVIDLRDIIYFISVAAFFILLTKTKLQSRKW